MTAVGFDHVQRSSTPLEHAGDLADDGLLIVGGDMSHDVRAHDAIEAFGAERDAVEHAFARPGRSGGCNLSARSAQCRRRRRAAPVPERFPGRARIPGRAGTSRRASNAARSAIPATTSKAEIAAPGSSGRAGCGGRERDARHSLRKRLRPRPPSSRPTERRPARPALRHQAVRDHSSFALRPVAQEPGTGTVSNCNACRFPAAIGSP